MICSSSQIIIPEWKYAYDMHEPDEAKTYEAPYDKYSVMHYSR